MCILLTKTCQHCGTNYFENWKECPFMYSDPEECHEHRLEHQTEKEAVLIDCGCITLRNRDITLFARSKFYTTRMERGLYAESDDGADEGCPEAQDPENWSIRTVESDGDRWRAIVVEGFKKLGWVKDPEEYMREADRNSADECGSGRRMVLPLSALSNATTQTAGVDEEDAGQWDEDGCGSCVFSALS
jgi:hypothetical protein